MNTSDYLTTRFINQAAEPNVTETLYRALKHDDPLHASARFLAALTARDERVTAAEPLAASNARVDAEVERRAIDAAAARITALATAVLEVVFTVDGVLGALRWTTDNAVHRAEFDALRTYLREQTGNLREIRDAA
jgi:hypothetical protein